MSQQAKYTLTENTTDGNIFDLRGKLYFLRYPVVSEVEKIQDLSAAIDDAEKLRKDNPEEYKRLSKDLEDFLYSLISPVDHDEDLQEALQKENIKVYRNFNNMIKTELSLQG